MHQLRVMICDDEPLANRRLGRLLADIAGVEVVASVETGEEAVAAIETLRPDLALLDIEMPDMDGFDVVDRIARTAGRESPAPLLAFVTAFPQFAFEAFESGAIDFLAKPVRRSRLETTIERARAATISREARQRLDDLQGKLDSLRAHRDPHVWIHRRGELVRFDLEELDRASAEGAYVRLHQGGASMLHREAIGSIERRLDPARFIRVHRSHIVRTDLVTSIRRTFHGGSELLLRDGTKLPLGRKFAKDARATIVERDDPQ